MPTSTFPSISPTVVTTIPTDKLAENSTTTGSLSIGSQTTSNLEFAGDKDWFKVQLQTGVAYVFELKGAKGNGGTLGSTPYLKLYDSSSVYFLKSAYDGGANDTPKITYIPNISGNYFIEVSDLYDKGTGTYTVTATSADNVSDDYAESPTTQGSLTIASQTTGNLEFAGDRDWFRVSLESGADYIFELKGAKGNGGTLDSVPYLKLYNSSNVYFFIESAYKGGADENPKITYTATSSGNYYLEVDDLYEKGTGTYTLSATSGLLHQHQTMYQLAQSLFMAQFNKDKRSLFQIH